MIQPCRCFKSQAYKVEYALTDRGSSIKEIISSIVKWGIKHRETVFGKAG